MTVVADATPAVSATCPDCGAERTTSVTTVRRIATGEVSGRCFKCRRLQPEERYRRWWLHVAGVEERAIADAGSAEAWVRAHGLPEVLWEMAAA